jgi:hypothetical protein
VVQTHVQSVERLLELVRIPDIHDHILLEQAFDYKQIRQETRDSENLAPTTGDLCELRWSGLM